MKVKFINNPNSEYVIRSIEVIEGAPSSKGFEVTPTATWSDNLIKAGEVLNPGEYFFFDINMPSQYECKYRITVNDTTDGISGNDLGEVIVEYALDETTIPLTITYWGGNKRTAMVNVLFDDTGVYNDLYNGVWIQSMVNNVEWYDVPGSSEVTW